MNSDFVLHTLIVSSVMPTCGIAYYFLFLCVSASLSPSMYFRVSFVEWYSGIWLVAGQIKSRCLTGHLYYFRSFAKIGRSYTPPLLTQCVEKNALIPCYFKVGQA